MTFRRRLLPAGVSLLGAALLVPGALPVTAQAAASHSHSSGPRSAVTWNGWRGVHFGDSLTSAHRRLGGRLERTDPSGGCGDVVTTRTGSLDGNVSSHPHRVGDIVVKPTVQYPFGITAAMPAGDIVTTLETHGLRVHTHRYDPYGTGDFIADRTSVGPHGHTLYFASDASSGEVYRMGLAVNRTVAGDLLDINGC